jgi:hypothetical protein
MQLRSLALVGIFVACSALLPVQTSAQQNDVKSAADRLWAKLLTKCGDTYYTGGYSFGDDQHFEGLGLPLFPKPTSDDVTKAAAEFKGVSFVITTLNVTQADKLNGIEWSGILDLYSTAFRTKGPQDSGWGEWENGSGDRREAGASCCAREAYAGIGIDLVKQRGTWLYHGVPIERLEVIKPSCDEAKKINQ